jgi:hypothetical protein
VREALESLLNAENHLVPLLYVDEGVNADPQDNAPL